MRPQTKPTILVIVGITGDLAKRKLLPAMQQISKAGALPDKFHLVGVSRRAAAAAEILEGGTNAEIFSMDLAEAHDYDRLAKRLDVISKGLGGDAQRLFYLSVPPHVSQPIIELLGMSGLAAVPDTKLLLEKPFGTDLASATDLVEHIGQYFTSEQTYRIDHYLAKEMAQNLVVFREGNSLIKRTWNKEFIERIEILASEKIDIEGRTAFYEQTGALRDVVQSHLLQLAALVLMRAPEHGQMAAVPARRLEALRLLRVADPLAGNVRRAQYRGYREEVGNAGSMVETRVQLRLESSDERWVGVPIELVTGKALDRKSTEIRITYRRSQDYESNQLVLRLQPDEGFELDIWTKAPGYDWKTERHALRHGYGETTNELPEAYEQVLLDAIRSNHGLFTTSDEVLAAWRILAPVQQAWSMSDDDLEFYDKGTAGPADHQR